MLQELFRIPIPGFLQGLFGPELPIFSYGLMLVIGFLLGVQLGKFLFKRYGLDPELFVNASLLALITGIIGARVSHILENLPQYTDSTRSFAANFKDAINIRSGGLTYYGGFLLAFPTLVVYAIKKKIPLRFGMDVVAPCLMIGLAFGRIGCFLNGCCYGAECDAPWAVRFPYHSWAYQEEYVRGKLEPPIELLDFTADPHSNGRPKLLDPKQFRANPALVTAAASEHSNPLHPAQLYSALTAFLVGAIVLSYFTLPHIAGRAFALMLMLEGGSRVILETLRVEPTVVGPLSLSMLLGSALCLLGVILWFAFGKFAGEPEFPVTKTQPT